MPMSNSYEKIRTILHKYEENQSIAKTLKDADSYWAHTPKPPEVSPETLGQHLHLVQDYFLKLITIHHLDDVIDRLISEYLNEKRDEDSELLGNYIKKIFVHTICYHDHGKVNENFQASSKKMNNPVFKGKENPENKIDTQHSTLSSFIFLNHKISEITGSLKNPKDVNCGITIAVLLSYNIYRHHSFHLRNDFWHKIIKETKRSKDLKSYLNLFPKSLESEKGLVIFSQIEKLKSNKRLFKEFDNSFALYQILRLNFSLLTAADYLATNEYMNRVPVDDFGTLSQERKKSLYKRVTDEKWIDWKIKKVNFNKQTFDQLEGLDLANKPNFKSNVNLNLLRQQMATEAIRNIRKQLDKNIFYLEAPTGGGKTNIS